MSAQLLSCRIIILVNAYFNYQSSTFTLPCLLTRLIEAFKAVSVGIPLAMWKKEEEECENDRQIGWGNLREEEENLN